MRTNPRVILILKQASSAVRLHKTLAQKLVFTESCSETSFQRNMKVLKATFFKIGFIQFNSLIVVTKSWHIWVVLTELMKSLTSSLHNSWREAEAIAAVPNTQFTAYITRRPAMHPSIIWTKQEQHWSDLWIHWFTSQLYPVQSKCQKLFKLKFWTQNTS